MAKTERIGGVDRVRLRKLAKGRYWSESDGREALAAFEASGLTQVAFRRQTGIGSQRLRWWRRRLGATTESAGRIEFVPVEVTPRTTRAAGDETAMEIVLGEIRVRVGPGFDPAALQRLLAVLAERAC
ncbi:IS66 family insertion sequence element accessory protein TnpA [Anaeromyxobacter oryzisoli]|uniref:IS66 family insertion sequence element accessory protein TnpA n=1 Tax=Anaeromyxobacter oryzisoli TaxID=2925408 RepID=UPI001F5A3EA3|nr:IS66 family insertion sequence element accessory protein TnpB [Anaeromyxobacter sp. SG63]